MELTRWAQTVEEVSAGYAEYYGVERSAEWALLKLTEEVGELVQAYLTRTGQGRDRGLSAPEQQEALALEVADVLGMVLIAGQQAGVDIEAAMRAKWLPYAQFHRERAAARQAQEGSGQD